jgi:hypothetical protein
MTAFKRIFVISVSVFGAAALVCAQSPDPTFPVPLNSQTQTTPLVGISSGQVARLNALNPGVPAPLATGALCAAQLSFVDANGAVLKTKLVLVAPGKSEPLDLNHDTEAGPDTGGRFELRAVVRIPPVSATAAIPAFCTIVPSLEIFDADTGKTQVVVTETKTLPGFLTPVPTGGGGPL